ncbi:MAG TPA: FtsX-like permease family protein, partial [Ktedonobacteraceae bacterium]
QRMHFVALAKVDELPGVQSSTSSSTGIGLLADYQSYTTVYAKDNQGQALSPNTVWLRTADDAASLASVRQAVPNLMDRRALLEAVQTNPAYVDMLSIFVLGTIAALGLAILGTLIVSWVSMASRRTQFAALHALGMPTRQINAILIWEHGIVYALALALAIGLGWLVSFSVGPGFSLIRSVIYDPASTASNVPVHASFPLALAVLLVGALFIVNGVVLGVGGSMSRPSPADIASRRRLTLACILSLY